MEVEWLESACKVLERVVSVSHQWPSGDEWVLLSRRRKSHLYNIIQATGWHHAAHGSSGRLFCSQASLCSFVNKYHQIILQHNICTVSGSSYRSYFRPILQMQFCGCSRASVSLTRCIFFSDQMFSRPIQISSTSLSTFVFYLARVFPPHTVEMQLCQSGLTAVITVHPKCYGCIYTTPTN